MRERLKNGMMSCAAVSALGILMLVVPMGAQAPASKLRTADGKPNMNGVWQANNTANWDLQDHAAAPGPFYQLGAIGAVPPGQTVVDGGDIPYLPAAAELKRKNFINRWTEDPEVKCYLPGLPRATYMPYPFQIVQSPKNILFAYEYASANRVVNMDKPTEAPVDSWMGWSNGKWDGDTLVVDVRSLNGKAWLSRAGDPMTDNAHIVERYTTIDDSHINYEATVEDRSCHAPLEDHHAALQARRAERTDSRVQVRRVLRGDAVRPSAQGRPEVTPGSRQRSVRF